MLSEYQKNGTHYILVYHVLCVTVVDIHICKLTGAYELLRAVKEHEITGCHHNPNL